MEKYSSGGYGLADPSNMAFDLVGVGAVDVSPSQRGSGVGSQRN